MTDIAHGAALLRHCAKSYFAVDSPVHGRLLIQKVPPLLLIQRSRHLVLIHPSPSALVERNRILLASGHVPRIAASQSIQFVLDIDAVLQLMGLIFGQTHNDRIFFVELLFVPFVLVAGADRPDLASSA